MSASAIARAAAVTATAMPLAACAAPSIDPSLAAPPTIVAWRAARARLAAIRRAASAPRTQRVALRLREPRTGRVLEARGAVAIAPPRSLRMILLGPGGTTALDLWIDGDRFRFAVPAIELLRRGDASTPRSDLRGLPIDFLRWWLLVPADGALLWAARDGAAQRLVLRDGHAVVDLRVADDGRVDARRASWSPKTRGAPPRRLDEETARADRVGCGVVRYHQASTGLDVTVTCEGEELTPPNPRAFADPDAEVAP